MEEGRKARSCAIVVATADEDGNTKIYVAPITHSRPDDTPSWIVTSELNRFIWPGYDLRPIARDKPDVFAWGFLPVGTFAALKQGIAAHQRE